LPLSLRERVAEGRVRASPPEAPLLSRSSLTPALSRRERENGKKWREKWGRGK